MDREKVIKGLTVCSEHGLLNGEDCHGHYEYTDNLADIIKANDYSKQCPYNGCETGCVKTLAKDVFAMLKEQDELLRKLQKDKDKLCLEVSEWKHKFHDRQIKEQDGVAPYIDIDEAKCPVCKVKLTRQELIGDDVLFEDFFDYCPHCGRSVKWDA